MIKGDRSLADCRFVGSALKELRTFPEVVKDAIGHALHEAQCGLTPYAAKMLKGFGGGTVLELVEDDDGKTYRAVYTVRFAETLYVLHCFQKKSKSGIATPQKDIELIKRRLKTAEMDYEEHKKQGKAASGQGH